MSEIVWRQPPRARQYIDFMRDRLCIVGTSREVIEEFRYANYGVAVSVPRERRDDILHREGREGLRAHCDLIKQKVIELVSGPYRTLFQRGEGEMVELISEDRLAELCPHE